MKYTKKPIEVEAFKWTGGPDQIEDPKWMVDAMKDGRAAIHKVHNSNIVQMWIETLEGRMTAQPGDYIIQGVEGKIYPCKPSIFEATYQKSGVLSDEEKIWEIADLVADSKCGRSCEMEVMHIETVENSSVSFKTRSINNIQLIDKEYKLHALETYGDKLANIKENVKTHIAVLQGILMYVEDQMQHEEYTVCPECNCQVADVNEHHQALCKHCGTAYKKFTEGEEEI